MTDNKQNTTLDAFLGGKFYILQYKKNYHRAGIEPIILASFVPSTIKANILDMGAGTGTIGFAVAARCQNAKIICAEKQIELVRLMEQSKKLPQNKKFAKNVTIKHIDVEDNQTTKLLKEQNYHWVLANPPFYGENSRVSPFLAKKIARHMPSQIINKWIKTANIVLKDKGTLLLIVKPDSLGDNITALVGNFGNIRLLPIQAQSGKIAKRIIIMAQKNSKTPMTIQPPLVIHKQNGEYRNEIKNILRPKT